MSQNYPGLITKGNSFYFRLGLPRKIWNISKCKEIGYSLNTSDIHIAVTRWRKEFTHFQIFIDVFEKILMKLNSDNKLILTENDIDKILLYRLEQIQHFIEESTPEIEAGTKTETDILLSTQKNGKQIRQLMVEMIVEYLKGLVDRNLANQTLRTMYSKLKDKEIDLGLVEKDGTDKEWFKSLNKHMSSLEKYATHAVKAIKQNTPYSPSNPKVKTLLQTYDAVKTAERMNTPVSSTPWKKLFKRFAENKRNRKGTCEKRINRNHMSIMLFFYLLKKDYVEDITKHECRKFCELVYMVPKIWHRVVKTPEDLDKILTKNPNKVIGKKNIKDHMITVKEFLRYAAREDIIPNSLNEFFDPPVNLNALERKPFTSEELRLIFNPKTYPNPHSRRNTARFWVPLIALYQGCRLSEITQLDTTDVISHHKVPCFSINDNGNDKAVKTKSSNRIIPIHPQLIKMGFLSYVQFQSLNHKKKLFVEKSEIVSGRYYRAISQWFARYIDDLGIKDPSKVFHSFRHTFATKAIEKRVPTEYQNSLGGWVEQGIGQKIYGKDRDIKIMLEELTKITFPIQKELKVLEEEFRSSWVMNLLTH